MTPDGRRCQTAHYASVVEAMKDVEVYQLDDVDCADCLRRMAEKHEALAVIFQARLAEQPESRCRVYDSPCINASYCDLHDACCAGDPECKPEDHRRWTACNSRALCHACSEVVEVSAGKLVSHHGASGECSQNGADAQIYLHPKVADRIAELETALAARGAR